MVVAQKVKESEITEQDSLLLVITFSIFYATRNLLRIAIFNISYIRGLFPEKYFNDKSVPALDMKIKKLMPMDAESRRLIDWMEKGVYDALQKKYLKTLLFCVCETVDGPMIEEYSFSFSYSNSDTQEVSMNINRSGTKKGGSFKCNSTTEITPSQMRSSACKMVRTLVQLMRTLDKMPEERTVLMKLLYYDDVTPSDYEPPFFRGCTEEEARNSWTRNPLRMEVGRVNSKHLVLALKVKSVLDPCEDENNDNPDDEVSLGADSTLKAEDSESESEISDSDDDQYIVAPIDIYNILLIGKQQCQENGASDEDDTQDPSEDEKQFGRVKYWIISHHLDTVELTDVLSNFPDISVILIEGIMERLVNEGVMSKAGVDSYFINRKKLEYEFDAVKEEDDGKVSNMGLDQKAITTGSDRMYMKALYHALPMNYVSISKLQSKLDGEANQGTVRKLIDKMIQDGFVEVNGNRRLGKRVIHSDLTKKKLNEVKKILDTDAMDLDMKEPFNKSNHPEAETIGGNNHKDMSTCGGLHSIGSDVTRTRGRSDPHQNGLSMTESGATRRKEHLQTPTSRIEPAASRESFVPGAEDGGANEKTNHCDEVDIICSKSTQDKRCRKASTVESDRSDVQLKHLGFVRIVAINAAAVLSNVYGYAKRNSGPLKSAVGAVENAVTTVVNPVYDRFKGVPDDLLIFADKQVDKAARKFDECAPPGAKNVVFKGQLIVRKASQIAQDLVKEAQDSGPLAAVCHAGTLSKQFAVSQLAVVWYKLNKYPALHGVSETAAATATHLSEKYNKLVRDLAAKGNNIFNYFPLVPVDEIARAYKQVEAAANKKVDASSSSGSDSDKD
ncbi:HORMA domain-containing protein 1 [Dorcoceras hygrometricum]|uniref:HORMA domain-containing protein 1 n=1 Tax=Dorcoceras hygrometricum TaxID=472368 RepID=A0A2Z7BZB5_9LAMI|nr:HORMA domain-containing protein 1 [Dorcoceras hygrometricum]